LKFENFAIESSFYLTACDDFL